MIVFAILNLVNLKARTWSNYIIMEVQVLLNILRKYGFTRATTIGRMDHQLLKACQIWFESWCLVAEKTAWLKAKTKEKLWKHFCYSRKHVVFTEPLDVQAGSSVTVFYDPSNTNPKENLRFGLEAHLIVGLILMAYYHLRECCLLAHMPRPLVFLFIKWRGLWSLRSASNLDICLLLKGRKEFTPVV